MKKTITHLLGLVITLVLFSASAFAESSPFKSLKYTWSKGAFSGGQYQLDLTDTTAHWQGLAGPEEGQSAVEDVVAYVDLGGDRHLITFLEKNSYTVTLIINAKTDRIDGIVSNEKEHYVIAGTVDSYVKR
jgi:hypothetical protein